MNAVAYPAPFVGQRTEPARVTFRPELPLCVRVDQEQGRSATDAQFWHDVDAQNHPSGLCHRCLYLEGAPHRYNATLPGGGAAVDLGTYTNEAGRAAVASGVWEDDMLLTAEQAAGRTARRLRGER